MYQTEYKRLTSNTIVGLFLSLLSGRRCGECGTADMPEGTKKHCSTCAVAVRKARDQAKHRARYVPKTQRKPYELKAATAGVCPVCAKVFIPRTGHQKYCSGICRNHANNTKAQMARRNSGSRPCRLCGVTFTPAYGSLRRGYCTTICRDAAKRKVRSGSSHRRRAKRYGCEYEPISKLVVFERDGWKCYLCGCDTPRHFSGTTEPNAPELEHVVPLSSGGGHIHGNVRCACRSCNRRKGANTLDGAGYAAPPRGG